MWCSASVVSKRIKKRDICRTLGLLPGLDRDISTNGLETTAVQGPGLLKQCPSIGRGARTVREVVQCLPNDTGGKSASARNDGEWLPDSQVRVVKEEVRLVQC